MSLLWLSFIALLVTVPAFAQQDSVPARDVPRAEVVSKTEIPVHDMQVECTPASRASELIGSRGCVSGRVFRVTTSKSGATHIALCPRRKCTFQAVVRPRDRNSVGDLSYLQGKFVGVLGGVVEFRGHPQILINDRQQIRAAAGDPPPEFDAAQPRASNGQGLHGKRERAW